MRPVEFAFGSEETSAGSVDDAGFLPFPGKNVSGFIRLRMDVGGNGYASGEFAQQSEAASSFIFVKDEQLNAGVWSRLPFLFGLKGDILEHAIIQSASAKNAMRIARDFFFWMV